MNNYQELKKAAKDEVTPSFEDVHRNLIDIWHDLPSDETRVVMIPPEYTKDMSIQLDVDLVNNYCFDDGMIILGRKYEKILLRYQSIQQIGDGQTINWED